MSAHSGGLIGSVHDLLRTAVEVYIGTPAEPRLRAAIGRLDEPLRVAVAGKVKAGKSTLLNALVGEELAPTDAGECTKIVTWYRDGITYRVSMRPRNGDPVQVPFTKEHGPIEVDLAGRSADDLEAIEVEWPSATLRSMTLVDTPGIASLSPDAARRTHDFLTPGVDEPAPADAVLYLMRHVHTTDVRFLEAFHDDELAHATPVNAIGVLSRADELGVGRADAMVAAERVAGRYRSNQKIRQLCQTVVPVAGLLAQSAQTLREDEFRALTAIAAAPREETARLLLSCDRFTEADTTIALTSVEREHLIFRFGLFGVRLATLLIREGTAQTSADLARELVDRSGLRGLQAVLSTQFAGRSHVLKARSALLVLESVLQETPLPAGEPIGVELERIQAGAHEFAEVRLLNVLRGGGLPLKEAEVEEAERLLGAAGTEPALRLGIPRDAESAAIREIAMQCLARWQRRAESPMSSREVSEAARVIVRTCEGLLAMLAAVVEPNPPAATTRAR